MLAGALRAGANLPERGMYPQHPPPELDPVLKISSLRSRLESYGAGAYDALVADVHTDVPCDDCPVPDPGSVLHEAVGDVDLLVLAVDNGPDRMVFGGPVLSHYEFELIGPPQRKSDSEWQSDGNARPQSKWPAPPPWTAEYLVPGERPSPWGWPP